MRRIETKVKAFFVFFLFTYTITMFLGTYSISASIPNNVVSGYLSGNYVPQAKTMWCWVASAENACICESQHYHTQYYAVNYLKGTSSDPYPNEGGNISETEWAVDVISSFNLNYIGVPNTKTFSFISEMIYNSHPVIADAGYYNSGNNRAGGHVVLIIGWFNAYGTQEICYYDPASSGSYHTCLFSEFCNGSYNGRIYDRTCYFLS